MFEELVADTSEEEGIEEQSPESYLVADIGHSNTRVTLFDLVEGEYRLVARGSALSTQGPPWYDAVFGLRQAIEQISLVTGRPFLDRNGQIIHPANDQSRGVDFIAAVTSIADPIRVLVAGLLPEASVASAQRVLHTSYAQEVDTFALNDERDRVAQVQALLQQKPDVILLTGGTEGGADKRLHNLVNTLAMGIRIMDKGQRPEIIYAGNSRLYPVLTEVLGDLTAVHLTGNVRPEYEREALDGAIATLADVYLKKALVKVPGLDSISSICDVPLKTTAHACAGITEYLSSKIRGPVLLLDIGSDQITSALATPEEVELVVKSDLGQGLSLSNQIDDKDFARLLDWTLPETTSDDVKEFLYSRSLRPASLPLTEATLRIEQSLLWKRLIDLKSELADVWNWPAAKTPPLRQILLRGGVLANSMNPRTALLSVVDAFELTGFFQVVADEHNVLPAVGLLASENPTMVVQVLAKEALENWGWVVAPAGSFKGDGKVLGVTFASQSQADLHVEIKGGDLKLLRLPPGETAEVLFEPVGEVDIGFGPGKAKKMSLPGGLVGLLIDARGRPLPVPEHSETRKYLRQSWLRAVA